MQISCNRVVFSARPLPLRLCVFSPCPACVGQPLQLEVDVPSSLGLYAMFSYLFVKSKKLELETCHLPCGISCKYLPLVLAHIVSRIEIMRPCLEVLSEWFTSSYFEKLTLLQILMSIKRYSKIQTCTISYTETLTDTTNIRKNIR